MMAIVMQLQPRQRAILAAVIEQYVETAEPVGSSTLAVDSRFTKVFGTVSSATIRNELADLEAAGLLAHPHTSAGRVPTDAGYRYYVSEMLKPRPVRAAEHAQISAGIAAPASSVEDALREATAALARLTGYPAVASLPAARRDTMRHVQINPVPPRRLILVLVTAQGRVDHRMFDIEDTISPDRLNTVVNFMNEKLSGQTLADLHSLEFDAVSAGLHDAATLNLARRAWELVRQSVVEAGDERIVVQGLITLLDEPEFSEIGRARAAMRLFEDTTAMGDLLEAMMQRSAPGASRQLPADTVVIGREHGSRDNPAIERFSFVGIAYGSGGEVLGTVGVMGPTRMKYADAMAIVPALAARLQTSLESL